MAGVGRGAEVRKANAELRVCDDKSIVAAPGAGASSNQLLEAGQQLRGLPAQKTCAATEIAGSLGRELE